MPPNATTTTLTPEERASARLAFVKAAVFGYQTTTTGHNRPLTSVSPAALEAFNDEAEKLYPRELREVSIFPLIYRYNPTARRVEVREDGSGDWAVSGYFSDQGITVLTNEIERERARLQQRQEKLDTIRSLLAKPYADIAE